MGEYFKDELYEVITRANRKFEAKKAEDPEIGEWYHDRVLFAHSSDSAAELLSLAERLFHLLKGNHISNDEYDIVDTAEDLCKEYKEYYAFDEEPKACWRMAVCLINKLIPDEYRLVLTDEDFGDWEFVKIREE